MRKDIDLPSVENVTIAIEKAKGDASDLWKVHLINTNNFALENTLVASKGYGKKNGLEQKTSTLRHFLDTVPANETVVIESIDPAVFHLNNEYWLSYYVDGKMYDKRFTFLAESIQDKNLTYIKEIDAKGILHS